MIISSRLNDSLPLLTVKDVARLLNVSPRTVYEHARQWGGFYPAGLRALRFKPDIIHGIMEGQDPQGLAALYPVREESLRRSRTKDEAPPLRSEHGPRRNNRVVKKDPNRHGLLNSRQ